MKRNIYLSLSFSSVPFEAVEKIVDAAEEIGAAFTIHIDDEIVAEPEETKFDLPMLVTNNFNGQRDN